MASYHDVVVADQSRAHFGDYHIHQYIEIRLEELNSFATFNRRSKKRLVMKNRRSGKHNIQEIRKRANNVLDRLESYADREIYSVHRERMIAATGSSTDISTMPTQNADIAVSDRLYSRIAGSPIRSFENAPSFYSRSFAYASLAYKLSVSAITVVPNKPKSLQYFIAFQKDANCWQRVIVEATFDMSNGTLPTSHISILGNPDPSIRRFPDPLHTTMEKFLDRVHQSEHVIRVPIRLTAMNDRWIVTDEERPRTIKDGQEQIAWKSQRMLRSCHHLGCEIFQESEVVVLKRVACYRHHVLARGKLYVERNVPFARDGQSEHNFLNDFAEELKSLAALRTCKNVLQLRGLVFDKTRTYLKGYLYELPVYYGLYKILGVANSLNSDPMANPGAVDQGYNRRHV